MAEQHQATPEETRLRMMLSQRQRQIESLQAVMREALGMLEGDDADQKTPRRAAQVLRKALSND